MSRAPARPAPSLSSIIPAHWSRSSVGGQRKRTARTGAREGDLARRAVAQARRFGAEMLAPQEVVGVRIEGPSRVLKLADGSEVGCRALLIATGIAFRKLDVPGLRGPAGSAFMYLWEPGLAR